MNHISPKAKLGQNVKVGIGTIIHDSVTIGDNSRIGDYCIIGHPARGDAEGNQLILGKNTLIRSHCVIYEGSVFADDLSIGHHTMVRERVSAGANLQIGSFNDLEGECSIGDYCRFHSNVHIGRGSKLGDLIWLFPYTVLTNDPLPPSGLKVGATLEDGVVVCTSSVILPGALLKKGAFVAAMSRAQGIVPVGAFVIGTKGEVKGNILRLKDPESGKQHPWMNHFSSYYPTAAQPKIKALLKEILDTLESECCA